MLLHTGFQVATLAVCCNLNFVDPKATQPQYFAVIGHIGDLLVVFYTAVGISIGKQGTE